MPKLSDLELTPGGDRGDCPLWIWEWLLRFKEAYGVWERVYLTFRDGETMRGKEGSSASLFIPHQTFDLTMYLPYDLEHDRDGYEVLTHEALHLLQGEWSWVSEEVIAMVPTEKREHARTMLTRAFERLHERQSLALTPLLHALWDAELEEPLKSNESKPTGTPPVASTEEPPKGVVIDPPQVQQA